MSSQSLAPAHPAVFIAPCLSGFFTFSPKRHTRKNFRTSFNFESQKSTQPLDSQQEKYDSTIKIALGARVWINRDPITEPGFYLWIDQNSKYFQIQREIYSQSNQKLKSRLQNLYITQRHIPVIRAFQFNVERSVFKFKENSISKSALFQNPDYRFSENNSVNRIDVFGLDSPGCDVVGYLGFPFWTPCIMTCCALHDRCYYKNCCTALSWFESATYCSECNNDAVKCMMNCEIFKKNRVYRRN